MISKIVLFAAHTGVGQEGQIRLSCNILIRKAGPWRLDQTLIVARNFIAGRLIANMFSFKRLYWRSRAPCYIIPLFSRHAVDSPRPTFLSIGRIL